MQGFNMGRYYPPDAENAPRFNTSHPLGARANKIGQGILTVRFEMPFAIWCTTCKPESIIGQGVRFNAEKKKVGNYHSTAIWGFRMKHTACGGWIEIRTDPKNTEYVVTEGARRRDYGPDERVTDGELAMLTEEERAKRREDAFAHLEGKVADKVGLEKGRERVEELYDRNEVWRDPYAMNRRLRDGFRVERKRLEKEARYTEGIQERYGLGVEIVEEIESDKVRAGLIEFGDKRVEDAERKPLFVTATESEKPTKVVSKTKKLKSEMLAEKSRTDLQASLRSNTRAAIDPFLSNSVRTPSKVPLGLKRKRQEPDSDVHESTASTPARVKQSPNDDERAPSERAAVPAPLVDYDSD